MVTRIQREDFDLGAELTRLSAGPGPALGAVASFVGLVRDLGDGPPLVALELEHYPGMAERALAELEAEARQRWPLGEVLVIHRYGRLLPGEKIVLVAVASAHRAAALAACAFLIDLLKTRVPFWKLEETSAGRRWLEPRAEDQQAAERWQAEGP